MRDFRFLRGFGSGVLIGILIGSVGVSAAAIGYKGWKRFSPDFRAGYTAGFVDMSNLARNLDPGGYIDQRYPYNIRASAHDWAALVDELYEDPENQRYTITSIMSYAAHILEERFGKTSPPLHRTEQRMRMQLDAVRKQREALALKPEAGETRTLEAKPKTVKPAPASKPPAGSRKWCRCDGKDPKAARAARREAAAAAEKAEAGGQAATRADTASTSPPNAPAVKTPPAAPPAKTAPPGPAKVPANQ